jgi:FdhD protein
MLRCNVFRHDGTPAIRSGSKVPSGAGIPILAAASCSLIAGGRPAEDSGLTLVGFLRGQTMNVYAQQECVSEHLSDIFVELADVRYQ